MTCERGSGSLLGALIALLLAGLTGAVMIYGLFTYEAHRIQGAADLAAIAGAEAQREAGPGCGAASDSAERNRVSIVKCTVTGDEVEFVVAVEARATLRLGAWSRELTRRANAGVVTGAPE